MSGINPEHDTSDITPMIVERVGINTFDVRRDSADDVTDPYVRISMVDPPHPFHPRTLITTNGVSRYTNYEAFGDSAVEPVGELVEVSIHVDRLDDARKVDIAAKIASLAFELSDGQ